MASPLYDGHIIFSNDLTAIKQKKKSLVLNKPIYAGMCILDLSKYWMYQFHYDVIKQQYGNRAKLLFTDTDSLCYHIMKKFLCCGSPCYECIGSALIPSLTKNTVDDFMTGLTSAVDGFKVQHPDIQSQMATVVGGLGASDVDRG